MNLALVAIAEVSQSIPRAVRVLTTRILRITGSFPVLVLLGNLFWTSASPAQQSANSQPDFVAFLVTWHGHVHGSHTDVFKAGSIAYPGSETVTSVITVDMTGSAIIRYQSQTWPSTTSLTAP